MFDFKMFNLKSRIMNLKSLPRGRLVALALSITALVAVAVVVIINQFEGALGGERLRAEEEVVVKESKLRAPATEGLSLYLNAADVRASVSFDSDTYLATSGGLIALDGGDAVKRRYTTTDGLPENDLTALAVFRGRLFIGTAGAGLIAFDGVAFTGYSFEKPKASRVSVLRATATELLIGTLDGGLFEYDGERFSRRLNSATGADFSRVTALLDLDSRLYVGTQDRGLYVWREAQIDHLDTSSGLPSPHVTALAALPSSLDDAGVVAAATDFGVVAVGEDNQVKPLSDQPNVSSLAVEGGRLWAGLFTGGVLDVASKLAADKPARPGPGSRLAEATGLPRSSPAIVAAQGGRLWALTREGAFARDLSSDGPQFDRVAGSLVAEGVITAGHITGLAVDGMNRLWVGYFDRGIDTIAPQTSERLSHIEDDRVREVNFILFDRESGRVLAATSRGLVSFDSRLNQTVFTRERNGLINDSIAHITVADVGPSYQASATPAVNTANRVMVLATAGGLTEVSDGRARSLTAFHGLASNHLYTSAAVGSRLFVGSLAGLVELEGLRVVRTYKTSNSRLSHDWVSATAESDGTLFVGTNGGGVDALLPTGEWINFAEELGGFEVNQNAMHTDGERVYVGTSDRGLLVYNTRDRRWTRVSAGLASQNVTAITSDNEFVYVGTLNGLVRIEKRVMG
jgi:ligand-binding sensor domain-containing protein